MRTAVLFYLVATAASAQDVQRSIYRYEPPTGRPIEILATNRGVMISSALPGKGVGYLTPGEVRPWLDGPVDNGVPAETLFAALVKARGGAPAAHTATLGMTRSVRIATVPGSATEFALTIRGVLDSSSVTITLEDLALRPMLDGIRLAASVSDSLGAPADAAVANGPPPQPKEPPLFEFQVERPVVADSGNVPPVYPEVLRAQQIEGQVVAMFIVDTTGHAEMDSFRVLRSRHELFSSAVRAAMPGMTFRPAEVGGKKVRQLVQMPFTFSIR